MGPGLNIFVRSVVKMLEQWRQVYGYEDYFVSSLGRVGTVRRTVPKLVKPVVHSRGYHTVTLYNGQGRKRLYVHRLVLQHFVGECLGKVVNHKNGKKTDNRLENLEWLTDMENREHALNNGLITAYNGLIGKKRADEIRDKYRGGGVTQDDLSKEYGVSQVTVWRIIQGKRWA